MHPNCTPHIRNIKSAALEFVTDIEGNGGDNSPLSAWRERNGVSLWLLAETCADIARSKNVQSFALAIRDCERGDEPVSSRKLRPLWQLLKAVGMPDLQLKQCQWQAEQRGARR